MNSEDSSLALKIIIFAIFVISNVYIIRTMMNRKPVHHSGTNNGLDVNFLDETSLKLDNAYDPESYEVPVVIKNPKDFWAQVPLRRNCPAVRGFKNKSEVIHEAELYYKKFGKNALKGLKAHFFMFSPQTDAVDVQYECDFVNRLLELGASLDVLNETVDDNDQYADEDEQNYYKAYRPGYELYGRYYTPLCISASSFSIELLKLLGSHGFDVSAALYCDASYNCNSSLHALAERWTIIDHPHERLEYYLSIGMNIHTKNNNGFEPIVLAQNEAAYRAFIKHGATLNADTIANTNHNPLYQHTADAFMTRQLLDCGCDPNWKAEDKVPVIFMAQNMEVFNLLKDAGANISKSEISDSSFHPIRLAIMLKQVQMAQNWLSLGFDMPTDLELTDLYNTSAEILDFLKTNQFDFKSIKDFGNQLLFYSSLEGAKWLMKNEGLRFHSPDHNETAFHYILSEDRNYSDWIQFLKDQNLDVNDMNDARETPLIKYIDDYAMSPGLYDNDILTYETNYINGLQTMIDCGADIMRVDDLNHTALWNAETIYMIRTFYKEWIKKFPEFAINDVES